MKRDEKTAFLALWDGLSEMANLPGYLFRIGQTRGIRRKRQPVVHDSPLWPEYHFEPALPAAPAQGDHPRPLLAVGPADRLLHVDPVTRTAAPRPSGCMPSTPLRRA
jgi:hypothetical protein